MPNIHLDEQVYPEVIQHDVHPVRPAGHTVGLLDSPDRSRSVREKISRIRNILGSSGVIPQVASSVIREATRFAGVRHNAIPAPAGNP
jgi:lipid A disaccharide synthetase